MTATYVAYQELLSLFEQSERKIKNVERITGEGLVFPSINQLRYSGHYIVKALLNVDFATSIVIIFQSL